MTRHLKFTVSHSGWSAITILKSIIKSNKTKDTRIE
jgi:hypothetical protein